jgi:hypothetical protein
MASRVVAAAANRKRRLRLSDLPSLEPTEHPTTQAEELWRRIAVARASASASAASTAAATRSSPWLARACFSLFGGRILALAPLKLLIDALALSGPVILNLLVVWVEGGGNGGGWRGRPAAGLALAALLLLTQLLRGFFFRVGS